jgi:hypothetical protein
MYHALAVILNRVELRIDETTVGYLGLATRVMKCRGLDRLDANGTGVEELNRLVSEAFGDRSKMIIDAYRRDYPRATPFGLYATIAAAWVRRPAFEQAIRKAALRAAPAYSYVYSLRTPVLDDRPGSFHVRESHSRSTMLKFATTIAGALRMHLFYRSRSAQHG